MVHSSCDTTSFSPHCQRAFESISVKRGLGVEALTFSGLGVETLISSGLGVETVEEVLCLELINDLTGIKPASGECLSGDSSGSRNLRKCATKSWKLCCHSWDPHRASAIEITQIFPVSHRKFVFGQMFTGTFLFISVRTTHNETRYTFLLKPCVHQFFREIYCHCILFWKLYILTHFNSCFY